MGAIKGAAGSVSSGAGAGAPPGVGGICIGVSVDRGVWVATGVHWVKLATKSCMTAAMFA